MNALTIIMLLILFTACNSNKQPVSTLNDTLTNNSNHHFPIQEYRSQKCDTSIIYDIDNVSSEGTEAEVCFANKQMKKAKVIIYGASGKTEIMYFFNSSYVDVKENIYKYNKSMKEIKNEKDIVLADSSVYRLSVDKGDIVSGRSESQAKEIYKSIISAVKNE